jgi:hypothetical protein
MSSKEAIILLQKRLDENIGNVKMILLHFSNYYFFLQKKISWCTYLVKVIFILRKSNKLAQIKRFHFSNFSKN